MRTSEEGLRVEGLSLTYLTDDGPLNTVRNLSVGIKPGEIYGLVGESGSGKTTFARGIVRYLPRNGRVTSGSVSLNGTDILSLSNAQVRKRWGKDITMVHQDPSSAVNPSMTVGKQIAEMGMVHLGLTRRRAMEKAVEMLNTVRMSDPERVASRYPHQLSGGQLQRVLIAIALSTNPSLLIMDEPTTALDVTTEAVILDLVRDLLPKYRTAVLYITHNLGVVARLCDRVGVIYAGELMEVGPVQRVFKEMLHPYTLGLLGSVPRVDKGKQDILLNTIPGFIPSPDDLPEGCIYHPRCPGAKNICRTGRPALKEVGDNSDHSTACKRWDVLQSQPDLFTRFERKRTFKNSLDEDVVLDVNNLKKYFRLPGLRKQQVHAVDDISVRVRRSFTMGIVGESGCGKTTLARCIAGLEKANGGEIVLEGEPLRFSIANRPKDTLKKIQMVFQNPDASLNPQHTAGSCIARPLRLLGKFNKQEIQNRVNQLLHAVNLPETYINRLPHELSGGEKQRIAIARAFATDPSLLICDEPISSLDVSVQASLLNLLAQLQDNEGVSYLFISHDLAAVRHLSHWIAVVYLGRIWEIGSAGDVFNPPQHPYTEALFSALPIPDPEAEQERIRLRGTVPSSVQLPTGCRFHTRCPRKIGSICEDKEPPWRDTDSGHRICCHIEVDRLLALQQREKTR